ncbi:hypothetical protein PABG_05800 [Paracoccidioides brasiliensis Pb03]|nr:hypothetical protein PABG_05800 [Paracoccidioides brasiliensis Pb03]
MYQKLSGSINVTYSTVCFRNSIKIAIRSQTAAAWGVMVEGRSFSAKAMFPEELAMTYSDAAGRGFDRPLDMGVLIQSIWGLIVAREGSAEVYFTACMRLSLRKLSASLSELKLDSLNIVIPRLRWK